MAQEKNFNARFKQKHDIEANWAKASFVPLAGEFIIYDKDENNTLPRFKVGDGETQINDLPFVDAGKMTYKGEVSELPSEANDSDVYKATTETKIYPGELGQIGIVDFNGSILINNDGAEIQVLSTGDDSASIFYENFLKLLPSERPATSIPVYFYSPYIGITYQLNVTGIGHNSNTYDQLYFTYIYGEWENGRYPNDGEINNSTIFYTKPEIYEAGLYIYKNEWVSLVEIPEFPFELGTGEQSTQSANSNALGDYSTSFGYQTQAGAYAFDFDLTHTYTDEDIVSRKYYLTSVEGIEVGLTYTIVLNNNYDFKGTIESIGDNYVTVSEGSYISPISEAPHSGSYLLFPEKPTIGTKIIGTGTAAFGYSAKALAVASGAEGYNTIAAGKYSHAEGRDTRAGYGAHAEGNGSMASGNGAHAEGFKTTALGVGAHTEGQGTTASSLGAHAEGKDTQATGSQAHAEGLETQAIGNHSHAEGAQSKAMAYTAHAEGADTQAEGSGSHSEGYKSLAQGAYAHAEGSETQALSAWTHAEGVGTIANGNAQHVQGKYNIKDHGQTINDVWSNKYAHIVGNGTSDSQRSNIHTLDWDGNAWFAGDVETGNGKVATKNNVNNIIDYLGTITPTYQTVQTQNNNIYSGLRASITAETITENGVSFLRVTPVAGNTTAMILDCYNFTIPFTNGKYYAKMLMRTNQVVTPYFRPLQSTYSDGTSISVTANANITSTGNDEWEEFIFPIIGTKTLDGQFKQCHIHFAGKDKTATEYTDSNGNLITPTPYFDILGWAIFDTLEEAKAHTFNVDLANSQTSVIDYLDNNKVNINLTNIPNETFKQKIIESGFESGTSTPINGIKRIGFTTDCDYIATAEDGLTAFENAIAAASDGDTLIIMPGIYNGSTTLNIAKNLNFIGFGEPTIDFPVWIAVNDNTITAYRTNWENITFTKTIGSSGLYDLDYSSSGGSEFNALNCNFKSIYRLNSSQNYELDLINVNAIGTYRNCTFTLCKDIGNIGSVENQATFYNCKFEECQNLYYGYWGSTDFYFCEFINNQNSLQGYANSDPGELTFSKCMFFLSTSGNSMHSNNDENYIISLSDCYFYGNMFTWTDESAKIETNCKQYVDFDTIKSYIDTALLGGEW